MSEFATQSRGNRHMKCLKVLAAVVVSIVITAFLTRSVEGQGGATEAPTAA